MTGNPGHNKSLHLIDTEAYRRVMAGQLPGTLSDFTSELSDWLRQTHPNAAPLTDEAIKNQIHDTWHRRHELIRGG